MGRTHLTAWPVVVLPGTHWCGYRGDYWRSRGSVLALTVIRSQRTRGCEPWAYLAGRERARGHEGVSDGVGFGNRIIAMDFVVGRWHVHLFPFALLQILVVATGTVWLFVRLVRRLTRKPPA